MSLAVAVSSVTRLNAIRPSVPSSIKSSRRIRARGSVKRWTPVPKGVLPVPDISPAPPRRADRLLALDAEVGRQDPAGRGGRGLRAEPAALDRDGHDHRARVVVRRRHDVPGLVALRAALGRAGLAGHVIGKPSKTGVDVPPASFAAARRPCMIAARVPDDRSRRRLAPGSICCRMRPLLSSTRMPMCGVTIRPPLATAL